MEFDGKLALVAEGLRNIALAKERDALRAEEQEGTASIRGTAPISATASRAEADTLAATATLSAEDLLAVRRAHYTERRAALQREYASWEAARQACIATGQPTAQAEEALATLDALHGWVEAQEAGL